MARKLAMKVSGAKKAARKKEIEQEAEANAQFYAPALPGPEMFESPESSTIAAATYTYTTESTGKLTVLFKDKNNITGRLYEYSPDMPLDQWQEFKSASSKGEHFHQHIRFQYKGMKVA